MANVKAPKLEDIIIPTFSQDEIKAMLSYCRPKTFLGERNRALVLCLLDSGLRASELLSLTITDVDYQQGLIKVMGKGKKERLVRIGNNARQQLWRYMLLRDIKAPPHVQTLWLSEEMRPFTKNGMLLVMHRLGKRAGIRIRCSPHTFRHTFAVSYLRAGGDIFTLQQLLGHSSLEMVKRYSRTLNSDDALKAHQQFSPVDRLLK
jgi:site-specific recombinase XerD